MRSPMNRPREQEEPAPVASDPELIAELKAIKRLLALMLLKGGVPQGDVAKAVGVRNATISQMGGARRGILVRSEDGKRDKE